MHLFQSPNSSKLSKGQMRKAKSSCSLNKLSLQSMLSKSCVHLEKNCEQRAPDGNKLQARQSSSGSLMLSPHGEEFTPGVMSPKLDLLQSKLTSGTPTRGDNVRRSPRILHQRSVDPVRGRFTDITSKPASIATNINSCAQVQANVQFVKLPKAALVAQPHCNTTPRHGLFTLPRTRVKHQMGRSKTAVIPSFAVTRKIRKQPARKRRKSRGLFCGVDSVTDSPLVSPLRRSPRIVSTQRYEPWQCVYQPPIAQHKTAVDKRSPSVEQSFNLPSLEKTIVSTTSMLDAVLATMDKKARRYSSSPQLMPLQDESDMMNKTVANSEGVTVDKLDNTVLSVGVNTIARKASFRKAIESALYSPPEEKVFDVSGLPMIDDTVQEAADSTEDDAMEKATDELADMECCSAYVSLSESDSNGNDVNGDGNKKKSKHEGMEEEKELNETNDAITKNEEVEESCSSSMLGSHRTTRNAGSRNIGSTCKAELLVKMNDQEPEKKYQSKNKIKHEAEKGDDKENVTATKDNNTAFSPHHGHGIQKGGTPKKLEGSVNAVHSCFPSQDTPTVHYSRAKQTARAKQTVSAPVLPSAADESFHIQRPKRRRSVRFHSDIEEIVTAGGVCTLRSRVARVLKRSRSMGDGNRKSQCARVVTIDAGHTPRPQRPPPIGAYEERLIM